MAAERHRARPRISYPGFTRLSCDIRGCQTAIDGDDAATARRVGGLMGWVRDPIFKTDLCPTHADLAPAAASPGAQPEEWADAVAFDAAIRKGGARGLPLNGEAFLHRSRVPLPEAPIDRLSRAEKAALQGNLLDLLEDGEPGGCSPYGCRVKPAQTTADQGGESDG